MTTTSPTSTSAPAGGRARVGVQRFGTFLSGMIMPNIAAFIAWGLITALFIPTGWVGVEGPVEAWRWAGSPILGGGEFVAAFDERPEVAAFQAFLASDTWANEKAKVTEGGGWVSANSGLDVENLATDFDKLASSVLGDPSSVIRFDASDLMPGEVGAGTFWTEMVNWIASDKSDQDVLDSIEASWPSS